MGFKCGIVGLPNVGKSTLFNALTATQAAESANYPFCTIEPNIGKVAVPDKRLIQLAELEKSEKIIQAQMEFVDIAGLVKGASKGEGLGNQFLANIREVDLIVHVTRCFHDEDITHVHDNVDPIYDIEIIETELILADLESATKRISGLEKKAKQGDAESKENLETLIEIKNVLEQGKMANILISDNESKRRINRLNLITSKPIIYVANVLEDEALLGNDLSKKVDEYARKNYRKSVLISSKIESEIANLTSEQEKLEFLQTIGLEETGLNKIIRTGYEVLNLSSYFTVGPKEARAWTFVKGITAPKAAGIIHTDFERGFIKAEVISFDDFINFQGQQKCKDAGKLRLEGKEYIVKDGDVIHFRFNV